MKQTLFAITIALSLSACTEPEDPVGSVDPIDLAAPPALEASLEPSVAQREDPPPGPICAGGLIRYFEWVCHFGQGGWKLDEVGHRDFNCLPPYGSLVGHESPCATEEDMHLCGVAPERPCTTGIICINYPHPTTFCYAGPPVPPTFPPGGGVNG